MGIVNISLLIFGLIALIVGLVVGIKQFNNPEKVEEKYANSSDKNNIFIKKYKEADPEYYRGSFVRLGLVVVLLMLILAFNFAKRDKKVDVSLTTSDVEELVEMDIPNTTQVQPPPPPPPPPPPQIVIVEDEQIIEEEVSISNVEVEMDEKVEKTVVQVKVAAVIVEKKEEEPEEPEIFTIVEQSAEYPGGLPALMKYLAENINYPPIAQENGIEGKVILKFVVDEVGGISNVTVLKDIGGGCGEEAVRVVKKMPKWKPGKQRGRAVKQYYTLPVKFTLTN